MAKTEIGKKISDLIEGLDKLATDIEEDLKKIVKAGKEIKNQLEKTKDED